MSQPPRVIAEGGAELFAGSAYDPTATGGMIAWQRPTGALLRRAGSTAGLPGTHPALGGGRIAWREGATIVVADASTLRQLERHAAPGAGVLAVSDSLLAWRTRDEAGTDRIWVAFPGSPPAVLLELAAPQELGRPVLVGPSLLTHVAGPVGSHLLSVDLATGAHTVLRQEFGAQVSNPATDGSRLLYVRATGRTQQLRAGPIAPLDPADDEVLLVHSSAGRRDREHEHDRHRHRHRGRRPKLPPRARPGVVATLWTTALTADAAYVTRLRAIKDERRTADILRVPIVA